MATKMITGVVQRVLVREKDGGADTFGNTHSRALQVNDTWYNFSGGTKPVWNVKIGDGFKVLGAGSEIAFKATTTVSKTNGKEYTNCNGLMVINLVEGENSPPAAKGGSSAGASQGGGSGNSYQAKPKDMSGISTGQSVNGAMNFLLTYGVEASNENIVKYGKLVHSATEKVKAYVKTVNPDVSEYEQGARGGLAVLSACKLVGTDQDFEEGVVAIAKDLVDSVFPPIMDFVKGGEKQPEPPVKVTRSAPAKKAATKAQPVEEEAPNDLDDENLPF